MRACAWACVSQRCCVCLPLLLRCACVHACVRACVCACVRALHCSGAVDPTVCAVRARVDGTDSTRLLLSVYVSVRVCVCVCFYGLPQLPTAVFVCVCARARACGCGCVRVMLQTDDNSNDRHRRQQQAQPQQQQQQHADTPSLSTLAPLAQPALSLGTRAPSWRCVHACGRLADCILTGQWVQRGAHTGTNTV